MAHNLNAYLAAIEQDLKESLRTPDPAVAPLYQMMQYHMGWLNREFEPEEATRGKRLRPLMCLLSCEAVGGDWRRALPASSAIEILHNFTLLHDDIEDQSVTRRHRATAWSLWGIPQAVNTGDAMWAVARLAPFRLTKLGHTPEVALRVVERLDRACLQLCEGQYLDLQFEGRQGVALGDYERMIRGKTAALLSASLAIGATLGGARDEVVECYSSFGCELGLAFQITDDILGIWGDPSVTGKSAASDIVSKKKTLPVLYALQSEQEKGLTDLQGIYARPRLTAVDVAKVLGLLERAGAREYARAQVQAHHHATLQHLAAVRVTGAAHDALRELAHALLDRAC